VSTIYTGQVQGVSLIAAGTPYALCREAVGGTLKIDEHNIRKQGTGGQLHVRRGTREVNLDLDLIGTELDHLAGFFPLTAGVQVIDLGLGVYPSFLVETDDGSGGVEWILENGQPSTLAWDLGEGPDSELTEKLAYKFGLATPVAAGTYTPVYNSTPSITRNDIAVAMGAIQFGVWSFSLSNDLGAEFFDPADGKAAGLHIHPDGTYVTKQDVGFTVQGSNAIYPAIADNWTPADITIACNNGTDRDFLISLGQFVPETWDMPVETAGGVKFAHAFKPGDGTIFGRVTIV